MRAFLHPAVSLAAKVAGVIERVSCMCVGFARGTDSISRFFFFTDRSAFALLSRILVLDVRMACLRFQHVFSAALMHALHDAFPPAFAFFNWLRLNSPISLSDS